MIQKRRIGFIIAIIPFFMATIGFSISANAGAGGDASMMKKEQDGSVTKNEFMKHHQWMFEQNDQDKNGSLDNNEMKNLHEMVRKMHERFDHKQH